MLHAGAVAVVGVLGLFAQQTAADANLVDFAGLCGAQLVADEAAQRSGLKGLLNELLRLLRVQCAASARPAVVMVWPAAFTIALLLLMVIVLVPPYRIPAR